MKIEEALSSKKQELENLQKDIESLNAQAEKLRDIVKKFKSLRKQSKALKETKILKQTEYDNIISFFKTVDDNYLNKIYPLFADVTEQKEVTA